MGILDAPLVYFPIDPYRTLMLTKRPIRPSRLLAPKPEAIHMTNQLIADNFYEWIAYYPDQRDALDNLDIPADPPLLSVNSAMVHGDKRGIADAVDEMRQMVEAAKRAAEWRETHGISL